MSRYERLKTALEELASFHATTTQEWSQHIVPDMADQASIEAFIQAHADKLGTLASSAATLRIRLLEVLDAQL